MTWKSRAAEPEGSRLRGRAGVAQRLRRLRNEPLCRHCKAKGRTTPSTTPDHIKPLAFGGTDDDSNIQCLCADCHAIKTAIETASTEGAANHPDWLNPTAVPLTIVCGPPCSGKTTYVAEHASPADTIIDIDAIARDIDPAYTHWSGALTSSLLNRAIRARNAMLGALERQRQGRAWFIVSAPTQQERDWWQGKLGGEVVLLHPGAQECKRRAVARGTPKAADGVDAWERRAKQPWKGKFTGQADDDGWPTDPRHFNAA
jgi:5-methylcytosine-specific restriction protein A